MFIDVSCPYQNFDVNIEGVVLPTNMISPAVGSEQVDLDQLHGQYCDNLQTLLSLQGVH